MYHIFVNIDFGTLGTELWPLTVINGIIAPVTKVIFFKIPVIITVSWAIIVESKATSAGQAPSFVWNAFQVEETTVLHGFDEMPLLVHG